MQNITVTSSSSLQSNTFKSLLLFWFVWMVTSSWLLISYTPDSLYLTLVNIVAYILCLALIYSTRHDVFSPLGIATIFCWAGFILPAPLFIFYPPKSPLSAQMLLDSMLVALTALIAFWLGYQVRFPPFSKLVSRVLVPVTSIRRVKLSTYLFLYGVILFSSFLRVYLELGHVGHDKLNLSIKYLTGIVYYFLTDVQLIIIAVMLVISLSQKNKFQLLISVLSLITFALASTIGGWKSGLMIPVIVCGLAYWYYSIYGNRSRRNPPVLWLALLIFVIPQTIEMGHGYRSANVYGHTTSWVTKEESFFVKTLFRVDGTYRLAGVVAHEGLSLSNDFKFISLAKNGMNAVNYANVSIWKIPEHIRSSRGAGGPGEWYIYGGFLGVLLGYLLIGLIYKVFYYEMKRRSGDVFIVVVSAYLGMLLVFMWSESSSLAVLVKRLFIVVPAVWVLQKYLSRRVQV